MVGKVVSDHGAVISSVTDLDSPAMVLKDTPYLKILDKKNVYLRCCVKCD